MKYTFGLIALVLILFSCQPPIETEYRYFYNGELNTLRIDDDSEYHFSVDNLSFHDVNYNRVYIKRDSSLEKPILFLRENKYSNDSIWRVDLVVRKYLIILPTDYAIETFADSLF